ncbi:50S ribosomal protein L21, partial [Candidatus Saccharibacteria bacterium]|nr:50S ribosomal protein L21 [Candidatus Saccharibacteria bacterium]
MSDKKAVIATGGKQYLVFEGQTLDIELLTDIKEGSKSVTFVPLLVINGDEIKVGTPEVSSAKVTADIVEEKVLADKVLAIRYKSKKRVHK